MRVEVASGDQFLLMVMNKTETSTLAVGMMIRTNTVN